MYMTTREFNKLKKQLDKDWDYFKDILSDKALKVLADLVETEIQIEEECNK